MVKSLRFENVACKMPLRGTSGIIATQKGGKPLSVESQRGDWRKPMVIPPDVPTTL
jgi:hypothetical protein